MKQNLSVFSSFSCQYICKSGKQLTKKREKRHKIEKNFRVPFSGKAFLIDKFCLHLTDSLSPQRVNEHIYEHEHDQDYNHDQDHGQDRDHDQDHDHDMMEDRRDEGYNLLETTKEQVRDAEIQLIKSY